MSRRALSTHSDYNAAGSAGLSRTLGAVVAGETLRVTVAYRTAVDDPTVVDSNVAVSVDSVALVNPVSRNSKDATGSGDYIVVEDWAYVIPADRSNCTVTIVPVGGATLTHILLDASADPFIASTTPDAYGASSGDDAPIDLGVSPVATTAADTVIWGALVTYQASSEAAGSWTDGMIAGPRIGTTGHAVDITLATSFRGRAYADSYDVGKGGILEVPWALIATAMPLAPPVVPEVGLAATTQEYDAPDPGMQHDAPPDPTRVVPEPGGGGGPAGQTGAPVEIRITNLIGNNTQATGIGDAVQASYIGQQGGRVGTSTGPVTRG